MCGFVSIYSADPALVSPSVLHAMTDRLIHRGPDDMGYANIGTQRQLVWRESPPSDIELPGVAFGHRRLSILDLSQAGRQPFRSPDGRFWMVYNGELYNYVELRSELRGQGCTFRTETDTEVVLTAYQRWGLDCLQRFNGMYAFVIWDNHEQSLVAARDRLGIKPLFYSRVRGQWVFASEVKALYRFPGLEPEPDDSSVFRFLWSDEVPGDGTTFYGNVKSLPAAHYLRLTASATDLQQYWSLPTRRPVPPASLPDAAAELLDLINDAVRLQLRADVPVGTMLSGGLDSTTIAAVSNSLLRRHVSDAESLGSRQRAISSFYPGAWNDESAKIKELAEILGIEVVSVLPFEANVLHTFMDVVRAVEEPFGGTMPIVQDLMMRKAREAGVAVTLNGHGPDEMFAGYPHRHCSFMAAGYLLNGRLRRTYAELAAMRRLHGIGLDDFTYTMIRIRMPAVADLGRRVAMRRRLPYFRAGAVGEYGPLISRFMDNSTDGRTPLERRLRRELFAEIVPRYLTYEDRVSMASSIESRVPFLDHRIVEFAFSVPDSFKISAAVTKRVMRHAVRNILPESIHASNLKVYIDPSFGRWLRGELRPLAEELLLRNDCRVARFVNLPELQRLVTRLLNSQTTDPWEQRFVWRTLVTEAWLRTVDEFSASSDSMTITGSPVAARA